MANGEYINLFVYFRLTWKQRCRPQATPDFGSVGVISSFLLEDIPRHPDTPLFEVREAFKRSLLNGFQAHVRAYFAILFASGAVRKTPCVTCCSARNRRRTTNQCPGKQLLWLTRLS